MRETIIYRRIGWYKQHFKTMSKRKCDYDTELDLRGNNPPKHQRNESQLDMTTVSLCLPECGKRARDRTVPVRVSLPKRQRVQTPDTVLINDMRAEIDRVTRENMRLRAFIAADMRRMQAENDSLKQYLQTLLTQHNTPTSDTSFMVRVC